MEGGGFSCDESLVTHLSSMPRRNHHHHHQRRPPPGERPAPLAEVCGPQGRAVTGGYVAAPVPSLAVPLLAGAAGEAVDSSSLRFLAAAALRKLEKEEDKEKVAKKRK